MDKERTLEGDMVPQSPLGLLVVKETGKQSLLLISHHEPESGRRENRGVEIFSKARSCSKANAVFGEALCERRLKRRNTENLVIFSLKKAPDSTGLKPSTKENEGVENVF